MKNITRRDFARNVLAGLAGLSGIVSYNSNPTYSAQTKKEPAVSASGSNKVSYRLEDFLDTQAKQRDIELNIYLENAPYALDLNTCKPDFYKDIMDIFSAWQINSKINERATPVVLATYKPRDINVFEAEIYGNKEKFSSRYTEITNFLLGKKTTDKKNSNVPKPNACGYAFPKINLAIIDAAGIEFKSYLKRTNNANIEAEIKKRLENSYAKDIDLKSSAGLVIHEVLHSMGMFHTDTFKTEFFEKDYDPECPNIMDIALFPANTERKAYCLSPNQLAMMHSYLGKGNYYKAFMDSNMDSNTLLNNISSANNIERYDLKFKEKD